MRTQRLKNRNLEKDSHNANYDDVVSGRRRLNDKDDAFYGITSEMFNFQSNPNNAKSALNKNPGLQERYDQFQKELKQRGIRQAHMYEDGSLDRRQRELADKKNKQLDAKY